MATVEKPQPMDVDPKKADEKIEEKTELVNIFFVESLSNEKKILNKTLEYPIGIPYTNKDPIFLNRTFIKTSSNFSYF